MGWSAREDALKVIELWSAKCRAETGMSGTYKVGSTLYFFENSRKEHDDGAVTGSIMKMLPNKPDGSTDPRESCMAVKAGSFKIAGDGSYVRGPAFLKAMATEARGLTHSECYARAHARTT